LQVGCQLDAILSQVAATRMQSALVFQILHALGGNLGSILIRLAAKWQIVLACIAASQMQNLHALAEILLQSRQFFAMAQRG